MTTDHAPDRPRATNPGRARKLLALAPLAVLLVVAVVVVVRLSNTAVTAPSVGTPVAAGPTSAELIDIARQALKNSKTDHAEPALKDGVERFPSDQALRLTYAEVLLSRQKFAEAYEQYDRAVALGEDRAEYRFAAGMAASQAGLSDHAEAQWLRARELDRANPQYPLFLAQLQRKAGRNADARANLMMAVKLDPALAVGWGTLAAIALDENHAGPALQHAEKAIALEPSQGLWRVLKAKILRRDNRPREALDAVLAMPRAERALTPGALDEIAACHGLLNEPRAAADVYIQRLDEAPEDADAAYNAAIWLQRAADPERAAAYAKRAAMLGKAEAKALVESLEKPATP